MTLSHRQTQLLVYTLAWCIWVQSSASLLALRFGHKAQLLAVFCFTLFYRWVSISPDWEKVDEDNIFKILKRDFFSGLIMFFGILVTISLTRIFILARVRTVIYLQTLCLCIFHIQPTTFHNLNHERVFKVGILILIVFCHLYTAAWAARFYYTNIGHLILIKPNYQYIKI